MSDDNNEYSKDMERRSGELGQEEVDAVEQGRSAEPDVSSLPRKRVDKKKVLIAIGVGLLAVVLIVGYLAYLISKMTSSPANNGPQATNTATHEQTSSSNISDVQRSVEQQQAKAKQEAQENQRRLEAERAQREAEEARRRRENQQRQEQAVQSSDDYGNSSGGGYSSGHKKVVTVAQRQLAGDVVIGGGGKSSRDRRPPPSSDDESDSQINDSLRSEKYAPGHAQILRHRSMLLARGTVIPCILQNRVVSDYPGLSSCVITRDVYSQDGKTVLLERGSIAYGEQKVAMVQGVGRLYMQWGQVDTPAGVRIDIDSLGVDHLGESGIQAWVDSHFWDRFGNSMMLSFADDAMEALASRLEKNQNGDQISFDNTSDNAEQMAEIALRNSINIKPTGYVNQGTRMGIRVARDVDFSNVYELEPNN